MPGKMVKDWKTYHALRAKGHSKSSAARIANSGIRKGSPSIGDVHLDSVPQPKKRKKRPRDLLSSRFAKHGNHDQSTHGNWARGGSLDDEQTQEALASAFNDQFFRNFKIAHTYPEDLEPDDVIISGLSVPGPFQYRSTIKADPVTGKRWLLGEDSSSDKVMRLVDDGQPVDILRIPKGMVKKHMGPGPHPSGTPQSVHGSGARDASRRDIQEDLQTDGGFTISPATGERPSEGYMVSLAEYEETFDLDTLSIEDIGAYRARHWSQFADIPNARWGGWVDDDGTVYFDVSLHVNSLDEAVALGQQWKQKAIFHLDSFSEIRLDDDGASLDKFRSSKKAA